MTLDSERPSAPPRDPSRSDHVPHGLAHPGLRAGRDHAGSAHCGHETREVAAHEAVNGETHLATQRGVEPTAESEVDEEDAGRSFAPSSSITNRFPGWGSAWKSPSTNTCFA